MHFTQSTYTSGELEEKVSLLQSKLISLRQCYKESLFLDKEFEELKAIRDQINQQQDKYDLLLHEGTDPNDQKS